MKQIIIFLAFMCVSTMSLSTDIDSLSFAVKHSFDSEAVKKIKYQSGTSFAFGKDKKHTAHVLFYTAEVNGIKNQIKVNCKVRNSDQHIEYCKPVKMTRI